MKTTGIDTFGILLYVGIVLFGIANIYSVDPASGIKQLSWFGISAFVGLFIFFTRSSLYQNLAGIFYIIALLLLVGIFPLGKEVNGQKNWYVFGPISLQPVEFVKSAIALMLANFVSSSSFNKKNLRSWLFALGILAVPGVMVLLQPDVGSLLVFLAFVIALYREGLSGWWFGSMGILAFVGLGSIAWPPVYICTAVVLLAVVFYFKNSLRFKWTLPRYGMLIGTVVLLCGMSISMPLVMEKLPKHQRERIEVLFKGEKAFRDTAGYNLLYSKTAIGSGGFFGKGYRQGSVTQGKFVPEQRTDYIFCTVGEEWGFLGSVLLVLAYALYIHRVYSLAENHKNVFSRVFGYCFASILMMHFFINMGMVMGLFPTVGIPLPYFSYGGSSLLAFSMMTFIFFRLDQQDRNSLV